MHRRWHLFAETWHFLRRSRRWWLGPILALLLFLSVLIVFTESSALAPLIYSLF